MTGLVLLTTGAIWFGVGMGVIFGASRACTSTDSCDGIVQVVGFTAIAASGVELPVGAILAGIGARTNELNVVGGRFRELP
jgi:hypothetical protein